MKNKLVDFFGRHLSLKSLNETQTDSPRLGHLKKHFADHPTRGLTPTKLASVLLESEQGNLIAQCELAEDIEEKDGHVFSELQKRKSALIGTDWFIQPPRDASAAEIADARLVEEILTDLLDLDSVILDMADAILKGFSNQEIEWQFQEGLHTPREIHYRDPSWFQIHPEERNQLRLRDQSYEGEALQPFTWISHIHKAKSGYLGRAGLVRVLAWPFLFKNLSLRDLAEFLEVYGLPIKLGRYPSGASSHEKSTLLKAVLSIGRQAGGIIPKGMDIEFKEAAKGASDPFEVMMSWCERTQSKAILGGTLTSQADGKSSTNALGNVHNEVRQELRDADLKQLAQTLTRDLVFPLYALNCKSFSGNRRLPRLVFDTTEAADLERLSSGLAPLVDRGAQIPVAWLHDELRIPQPQKDEAVLQPLRRSEPEPAQLKSQPGWALLKQQTPQSGQPGYYSQATQQQLAEQTQPVVDAWVADLDQLLARAEAEGWSLEKVQERLLEEYSHLPEDELVEKMGEAFAAASLAGRSSVDDEAQS